MFIFVKKNVFAFLLLQSFFLLAQPNCQLTISGVVLDTDTHEPLLYTNIVVVELNKVAIANDNGQYTINNLAQALTPLLARIWVAKQFRRYYTLPKTPPLILTYPTPLMCFTR